MVKWEYRVFHRTRPVGNSGPGGWDENVVSQLPQLGDEGWELVSIVTRSSSVGSLVAGVTTDEIWVFKRPKLSVSPEALVVVAQAEESDPLDLLVGTGSPTTPAHPVMIENRADVARTE